MRAAFDWSTSNTASATRPARITSNAPDPRGRDSGSRSTPSRASVCGLAASLVAMTMNGESSAFELATSLTLSTAFALPDAVESFFPYPSAPV